jgi:hypothetical protein
VWRYKKYMNESSGFAILLRGSATKRSLRIPPIAPLQVPEQPELFSTALNYNHRRFFKLNLTVKSDLQTIPTDRQRRLMTLVVMIVLVLKHLKRYRIALFLSKQYRL